MAELTPEHPPRAVTVRFDYHVSDEWIENAIAETGAEPARRHTFVVPLKDVPDSETRRRLLRAAKLCESPIRWPTLDRPEQDVFALLNKIEAWLAANEPGVSSQIFELEMRTWVGIQGSPRLRMAVERGYKANATYVRERAAYEYPTFWAHTSNQQLWRERTDPSLRALEAEQRVQHQLRIREDSHAQTRIVWLVEAPKDLETWLEDQDEAFEECEAILVAPYLGRYSLIQPLDLPRVEEAGDDS